MSPREQVLKKLEALGINPKRALGQNFLVSESVIAKIISAAKELIALKPESTLIEIGPGLGALTDWLKDIKPQGFEVIELDQTYAQSWRDKGLTVHEVDALKFNWLDLKDGFILVSNLPYQISSRLVVELSCSSKEVGGMVLMFQKEVAERIVAKPKTEAYGLLSVVVQSFWKPSLVTNAGQKDFYPAPNVGSRVLKFLPIEQAKERLYGPEMMEIVSKSAIHRMTYLTFIKAAFAKRRKMLVSNLKVIGLYDWADFLRQAGLNEKARAEDLSPTEFELLYKIVIKNMMMNGGK